MKLQHYFERIERIDSLIKRRGTGTPTEFAQRLEITERHLYRYIQFLRDELNAPIEYSKRLQSYYYIEEGELNLKWVKKKYVISQ